VGFRYKLRNTAYFTHVTQHVLNTDLVQRIDCHILRQKCQKNYFSWIYQRFQVAVKSLLCEDQLKTSMKTLSSFFSRKQRGFCASGLNTYTNSFTYSFRAKPFNIRLETGLEKLVHATDSASILHVRLDPQHRLFYLVTQCKSFDELPFKLAQKQKKQENQMLRSEKSHVVLLMQAFQLPHCAVFYEWALNQNFGAVNIMNIREACYPLRL